jgi:predicted  nucleic acid-binding Zn-ribbon protein
MWILLTPVAGFQEDTTRRRRAANRGIPKAVLRHSSLDVKERESRHRELKFLLPQINAFNVRLAALDSSENGFMAAYTQVEAASRELRAQIDALTQTRQGNDLLERVAGFATELSNAEIRINNIQAAIGAVPKLASRVNALEERIAKLKDPENGLVAQVVALRERFDELLDEDNGELAELEAGNPDENDDLDDQVAQLESDVESISERLDALDEYPVRTNNIRRSLAELAAKLSAVGE